MAFLPVHGNSDSLYGNIWDMGPLPVYGNSDSLYGNIWDPCQSLGTLTVSMKPYSLYEHAPKAEPIQGFDTIGTLRLHES